MFLTDHYADKIKKPINLGFLDFSILDQRRLCCEQELTLNRRLSSGVYLDVVTLRRDDQHYTFGAHGQLIEYALKMRRLPSDRSLEALLHHGEVTTEMIRAIARRLAVFHAEHPLSMGSKSFGTLEQVRGDWEEILGQFQRDYDPLYADEGSCCVRLETTQSLAQCVQQALAVIQEQKT